MKLFGMFAGVMLGVSAVMSSTAVAEEAAKPKKEFSEKQKAQQQRMKDCSADAKQKALKGDDRKAFMKSCLSGGKVTATAGGESASVPDDKRAAQKEKMKTCNADAKAQALQGDARKQFMSDCLAK